MIGLALSGGGAKGSYEVGAYFAFKRCHIKFDGIVGTSIGSFNAACIVAKKEYKLLNFWLKADVSKILKASNDFELFKNVILSQGLENDGLKNVLREFNLERKIRKSKKDFGLVTFKLRGLKPMYIFKEDMKKGSLDNYILSSCYFPIFKLKKLEDDSYYIDGGVVDNCPSNMLLERGYDIVYEINMHAIGVEKRYINPSKVISISPSRKLSRVITTNKKAIRNNIYLGYFDTLKVLKQYDGYKYIFKNKSDNYYDKVVKNIEKDLLEKAKILLKSKSNKEVVIKAVEHIMNDKKYSYFNIYKINKMIKLFKKEKDRNTIYKFVKAIEI